MRRLLVTATLLTLAADANAYVRTRSSKGAGTPSYWPNDCVFIMPDSAGTPDLPNDMTFAIIQKSMANWSTSCSYLALNYDTPAPAEAHYDGTNVIKFRNDTWCHPNDAQNKDVCYDASAAAITSVFMINDGGSDDGLILDADVELNDINFTFVVVTIGVTPTPKPNTSIADFENTLTHELGHLQGLSHTCKDAASFANDVDQDGNPPPDCANIPDAEKAVIENATMYNFASPGETKKRSPEADDLAGICNAYPSDAVTRAALKGTHTHVCEHTNLVKFTSRGGCGFAARAVPATPLFGLGLLLALVAMRRRRRG